VDGRSEVITARRTIAGDKNEARMMLPLMESHHANMGRGAETVVTDSNYGTVEKFLACYDVGVGAHIPDPGGYAPKRTEKLKVFLEEEFRYDSESDTYRCLAGSHLRPKSMHLNHQSRG
jgi:hypothetical protein